MSEQEFELMCSLMEHAAETEAQELARELELEIEEQEPERWDGLS